MYVRCSNNSAQLVIWGLTGDALRLFTAASEITWNNFHCINTVYNFCTQVYAMYPTRMLRIHSDMTQRYWESVFRVGERL
jgi:hypothetical protein